MYHEDNNNGKDEGEMNPNDYDKIIVFFSGGKDSTACVLHLLDLGVPKEDIERRYRTLARRYRWRR